MCNDVIKNQKYYECKGHHWEASVFDFGWIISAGFFFLLILFFLLSFWLIYQYITTLTESIGGVTASKKKGRILPKAASTCIISVAGYVKVVTTHPSYMNCVKHSCKRSGLILSSRYCLIMSCWYSLVNTNWT